MGKAFVVAAAIGIRCAEMNTEDTEDTEDVSKGQCYGRCNLSCLVTSIIQPVGKLRGAFTS